MAAGGGQVLMQHVGVIEAFNPSGPNSFSQWVKRFTIYCDANGVLPEPRNRDQFYYRNANRRRNMFLSTIGPRAFAVLEAAWLPEDPQNLPIPNLVALLKQHFEPAGLVEANRLTFHQRMQQPTESTFEYISVLQSLAVNCDWGDFYENALKSQLIVGLRHQDTRAKLVATPNLRWAGAKAMALQDDTLRQQMRTLTQAHNQSQTRVNVVQQPKGKQLTKSAEKSSANSSTSKTNQQPSAKPSPTDQSQSQPSKGRKFGPCHRCGRRHDVKTCPAINWECFVCNKTGHTSRCCPSNPKTKEATKVNTIASGTTSTLSQDQLVDQLLDFD